MRPDLVEDEVVRSDVVHGRRRQRPRTAAGHASARPLLGHLQRFLTPQPIHPVRPRHLALTVEVSWSEIRQAGHHQSSIQSSIVNSVVNRQFNRQSSLFNRQCKSTIDNGRFKSPICNRQSSVFDRQCKSTIDNGRFKSPIVNRQSSVFDRQCKSTIDNRRFKSPICNRQSSVWSRSLREPGRNGLSVIWPSNAVPQRPGTCVPHSGQVPLAVSR
jgi:hypothetical protein